MRRTARHRFVVVAVALAAGLAGCRGTATVGAPGGPNPPPFAGVAWAGYAKDAQHSAQFAVAAQPLARIHWQTPVDLAPQYSGGELLAHYGSPIITAAGTVVVAVKTTATGSFRVEGHSGRSGALLWQAASDYVVPSHDWMPSYNPTLSAQGRLYFPGIGGKVYSRDDPDVVQQPVNSLIFYGAAAYNADPAAYDAAVQIDTPISADNRGDIYFGFVVSSATPIGLQGGIARIAADGTGAWVGAAAASGDSSMTQAQMNCGPALSNDDATVYVAVGNGGAGYLLALDATTLATKGKVRLMDPASGQPATLTTDSSASPTVGPDGDVYYGVLETPYGTHNDRGWLLHFNAALSQTKTPGSFGWDDTASIAPASMVPSYLGTSSYLLMTKYNNYAGIGTGNGLNEIAILDPNATETDPVSGNLVMKEILTILGQTPDPSHPGGVREWCINSAVADPTAKSVYANSEDGYLYRWDVTTNSFPERIRLTSGIAESYTPTAVGPDGQVYAINNAVLFAIGQ